MFNYLFIFLLQSFVTFLSLFEKGFCHILNTFLNIFVSFLSQLCFSKFNHLFIILLQSVVTFLSDFCEFLSHFGNCGTKEYQIRNTLRAECPQGEPYLLHCLSWRNSPKSADFLPSPKKLGASGLIYRMDILSRDQFTAKQRGIQG